MNLLALALAPAPVLVSKIEVQRTRTVRLYGKLGAKFGRVHHLAVANPAEAVQALCALFPGFEQYMMEAHDHGMGFSVFVGTRNIGEKALKHPCGNDDIRIAPVLLNSKNAGWLNVILGIVLIVVGVVITGLSYGWAAPVGSALVGMGISMIVGGVIQLLSPQPKLKKPSERADNTPSYTFNGPVNTTAQGHPVPLLYGELVVGSAVASAGIDVEDQGYTPRQSNPVGGGRAYDDPDGEWHTTFSGGGSGSKQSRQPIEAPDSLHSTAYMRILDVVSEGSIEGLVNGLQSIKYNDTPLQNPDGSFNFQRVSVDWRLGTQDQDAIAGFDSVRNEIGVGVELKAATPWIQAITNRDLSAVAVRLSVPTLAQTDTTTGDTNGGSVSFKIELSTDGGPFQTIVSDTITGKTTTKYERQHRIDLPHSVATGWVIRVTRLTADSTSQTNINNTFIESFTEIVDANLAYPNTAHFGTLIDAQQFQSAPSRAFHLRGRNTIKVPSNYDPVTRTYSGVWDGTFKPAYTNNPAWVFYDLLLHPRYGLGRKVTANQVNKWALYNIARYCDALVPNGLGGSEPRMTCNVFLQTKEDAYKVLTDLAGAFASMVYWAGGNVVAACDMPGDPVYQYTPANVIDGKFEYSGSSKAARHTAALVTWNNPQDNYKTDVVYVEDAAGVARYGVNLVEVQAIGCTSIGQAMRYGRRLLATERMQTDIVSFGVGLDGAVAAPGQVVKIADPLRAGQRLGGRISVATSDTITVDKMPDTLPAAGDTLNVVGRDGSLISGAIHAVDAVAKTITMAAAFASMPVPHSIWTVERANLAAQQFRILSVTRPKTGQYAITAIKHEPGKFDYIDANVPIVGKKTVDISLPMQVTDITMSRFDRVTEYTTESVVAADWEAPKDAVSYVVSWKKDDDNWTAPVSQSESHSEWVNVKPGSYACRVACTNAAGFTGPAFVSDAFLVEDDQPAPGFVDGLKDHVQSVEDELNQNKAETQEQLDELNQQAQDIANSAAQNAANIAAEAATRASQIAAAAATAKAYTDAASDAAIARADAMQAQLNDIVGDADNWDEDVSYKKGDFVKAAGKLYRAKKDVPSGTELSDSEFWDQIGNYTSAGEAIAAAVSASTSNASYLEAQQTQLDAISARMPIGLGLLATAADMENEQSARATADAAETDKRESLSAKVTGFTDPTGKTISDLTTGLLFEEKSARTTAVSAEVAARQTLATKMTGFADPSDKALSDISSGLLFEEKQARITAITAETTERQGLESRIDVAEASLVNEMITRSNQHAAVVSSLNSLSTQLTDLEVHSAGYSSAISDLESAVDSNSTTLSSHAASITNLQASVSLFPAVYVQDDMPTGGSYNIGDMWFESDNNNKQYVWDGSQWGETAAVSGTVNYAQANKPTGGSYNIGDLWIKTSDNNRLFRWNGGDWVDASDGRIAANGTAITALTNRVTTAEGTLISQSESLTNLSNTVAGKASASSVSDLTNRVTTAESTITSQGSSLTSLTNTVNNKADSSALSTLSSRVTTAENTIDSQGSTLTSLSNTVAGKADSSAVSSLTSRVTTAEGTISSQGASLTSLSNSLSSTNGAVSAQSSAISGLTSRVTTAEGTLTSQASSLSTLSTTVSGHTSSITTQQTTLNGLMAKASITLDVNNYVTGWALNNNGSTGTFRVLSDKFEIAAPAGGARTEFSNGNWRVYDSSGTLRVQMGVW